MKSTAEHPFLFFDNYFENQIQKDLKEFYINITEELCFNNIEEIDKVHHIIKVPNIHHKEEIQADYITFSFEGTIKSKLKREINITKLFIESEFQKRFADKKETIGYTFTGKEIKEGVYWLVTGKNKFTSKISLFYFIEELIKRRYLKSNIITDLSRYIKYIFRDNHGNELKNLKQSKSTYSKSVTQKERIDTIISSL